MVGTECDLNFPLVYILNDDAGVRVVLFPADGATVAAVVGVAAAVVDVFAISSRSRTNPLL